MISSMQAMVAIQIKIGMTYSFRSQSPGDKPASNRSSSDARPRVKLTLLADEKGSRPGGFAGALGWLVEPKTGSLVVSFYKGAATRGRARRTIPTDFCQPSDRRKVGGLAFSPLRNPAIPLHDGCAVICVSSTAGQHEQSQHS
jgi:hypothetical protein